jgi:hypothetical protein
MMYATIHGAEERYMQLSTGAEKWCMQLSRCWRKIYATIHVLKKDICNYPGAEEKIYATIQVLEKDICNYPGAEERYMQLFKCWRKIYATIPLLQKDMCN